MESIALWNKIQLRTRIPMVSPIFHARVVCGRHQIRGNARGPTEQTAMTMKDFRKYHGTFFSAKIRGFDPSINSPQCLHFIAASWISSAQKGHFFIIITLGRIVKIPNQHFRKCTVNYEDWRAMRDLNSRPLVPETSALSNWANRPVLYVGFSLSQ